MLLVSDDQRPDTIASLGNTVIRTPNLDRLVASGVTFTRATCAHPLCVPSRAELLTGVVGFRNGVHPPTNTADLELPTLPRVLADAGYHSWHVGKWMIAGRPSARGFTDVLGLFAGGRKPKASQYDYRGREVTGYRGWMFQTDDRKLLPGFGIGLTPDISERFADAAIEFIRRETDEPYFLQVDFTAPHDPLLLPRGYEKAYSVDEMPLPGNFRGEHPFDHGNIDGRDERLLPRPRAPLDVRRDLTAYYAVIEHMDAEIGRILAAVDGADAVDNTIVIFTSDHGLALGSHGLMGKQNMYEHTINVPLIVSGPGVPEGVSRSAQCYLRDLVPTIYELASIDAPKGLDGQSLLPVLRGEVDKVYPFIVGYFANAQRMIRTDGYKYIWYPAADREQLFDLRDDPLELNSLHDEPSARETKTELRKKLIGWLNQHGDPLANFSGSSSTNSPGAQP